MTAPGIETPELIFFRASGGKVERDREAALVRDWLRSLGVQQAKVDIMSYGGLTNSLAAGPDWVRTNLVYARQAELDELEAKIEALTGADRVHLFSFHKGNDNHVAEVRGFLRRWLTINGSPERLVLTASDNELTVAYRHDKTLQQDKKRSSPRSGKPVDLNLADLLDPSANAAHRAEAGSTNSSAAAPLPDFNRLINDKVDEKLAAAIRDMGLSAETQKKVAKIATDAAEAAIAANLPKRLEIKVGQIIHTLPAEPRHKVFDEVLTLLLSRENVYLVGNAGTGKTHLFKQLAVALGRPVTILGQTLTKYEFSGHIGPTGEYVRTLLRTAVEEGHLLALDEMDMNAAAAIGFLNSLTANRYVAFPDKMVEAHPDFIVIAAANTYGRGATQQFIGRNPLDAASLDRFSYVECTYDTDLERQIYGASPWLDYVHQVRSAVEQLKLNHIISMRAIERGLRCLTTDMTAERTCQIALWRGLERDTVAKIKQIAGEFGNVTTLRSGTNG